jgi:hypothetical protein
MSKETSVILIIFGSVLCDVHFYTVTGGGCQSSFFQTCHPNIFLKRQGSRPEDFIGTFVISVQTSHQLSLIVNDIAEKLLI